jgi:hypothetical protein
MSDQVITNLEQVTNEWLTAVLTRSGTLTHGRVNGFDADSGGGNWSTSGSLQLHYSPDAQGERPSRLFLKMVNADTGDGEFFGSSEVDYYLRDYVDVPDAPLLRCYDGRFSPTLHRYHLLLEDVSASHTIACDKPPTLAYGLALAEAFAILHAQWWGAAWLAEAHAAQLHNPHSLQIQITAWPDPLPPLSAAVEVAAYRNALEAMTNAARLAQAQSCAVRLQAEDTRLTLTVVDDGRGLEPDGRHGVGFHSMRERAEELGGKLVVESENGEGVKVTAVLPLSPQNQTSEAL